MLRRNQDTSANLLAKGVMIGLVLMICATAQAKTVLCPATNIIKKRAMWQCLPGGPDACDGKAKFIGVALRDIADKESDLFIRYVCLYQAPTHLGDTMILTHKPKRLEGSKFLGKWIKGKGDILLYCPADDPKGCPIPAFKR